MRSFASFLVVIGLAAIIFGFMERVPKILIWIYQWGEGPAWAIKIGLVVAGAGLFLLSSKQKTGEPGPETVDN